MENVKAKSFKIGIGSFIHPSAFICGPNGEEAINVEIGDHTYIGERVQIRCADFQIGDYGKIHHDTNIHGSKPCIIGHNLWCGQFCIIDSTGGCSIGNNVGIGAHSQLWSHIKFGDMLLGCQFNSTKPLWIQNDVWFVGHCIVSPITASDSSMALVGSVVAKDMEANKVYAGIPAVDTGKKQFDVRDYEERLNIMKGLLDIFVDYDNAYALARPLIKLCVWPEEAVDPKVTWFIMSERAYTKKSTPIEIAFMKWLLPDKAKFIPYAIA